MKNFMKGLIIIISAIAILLKYGEMKKAKNQAYVEAYPKAVEEQLESKYGKKFIVNPKYFVDSSSPVPFSSRYAPYEFRVSEDGEDEYNFYVFVYPESIKNNEVNKIEDNYYWKSIKEETKEYLEREIAQLLPKEYKFIFIADLKSTFFDDNYRLGTPMEMYFKTAEYKESMRLYIITPSEDGTDNDKFTENNVYPILYDFYLKNNNNIKIKFCYRQTKTYDDYRNLDVKEFERYIYYDNTENRNLWSLLDTENKMLIEIE